MGAAVNWGKWCLQLIKGQYHARCVVESRERNCSPTDGWWGYSAYVGLDMCAISCSGLAEVRSADDNFHGDSAVSSEDRCQMQLQAKVLSREQITLENSR